MSYKLTKPYTETQKVDFIVQCNHKLGLTIEESPTALYALEAWEKLEGDTVVEYKEEYEEEQKAKEEERIAMLFLTGADVERGIYKAKGMDFEDILAFVTANPPEGLDIKALKIELKANNFYRGNPYVNAIGTLLGFTKEQLDLFFEDGNYEHLLVKIEEELPTDEIVLPEEPTDEPTESEIIDETENTEGI